MAGLVLAAFGAWAPDAGAAADQHDSSRLVAPASKLPDHEEFEATLNVPFVAKTGSAARDLELRFEYPGLALQHLVGWELIVRDARGVSVRRMVGEANLLQRPVARTLHWDGRSDSGQALPEGRYTMTLRAGALEARRLSEAGASVGDRVAAILADRAAAFLFYFAAGAGVCGSAK